MLAKPENQSFEEKQPPAESREKLRFVFPSGSRPLVKYKLMSKSIEAPATIFDAALIDLSEEGACLQGALPDPLVFDLGNGVIQLGCNLYLKDQMIKVLATIRWYKLLSAPAEFQFGVQFELTDQLRLEIQRFLIRHQIDTRRFSRAELRRKS